MARRRTGKRITMADGTVRVAGKAANGEGTIFWDDSGQRWRHRWVDINGQRRTSTGATQQAALDNRAATEATIVAAQVVGTALGDDPTIADLAEHWLDVTLPTVGPGTQQSYRNDVARIVERIGALPVGALDRPAVRSLIAQLSQDYRASTIRNTRTRLSSIAAEGIELGLLEANPTSGIALPRDPPERRTKARALTLDEQRRLLATLDANYIYDAGVAVLFAQGLRASEVLGLAWEDIDLDAGTAHLDRGVTYLGSDGDHVDTPKTERTYGTIHLAPVVIGLLGDHRERRGDQPPIVYEGVEIHPVIRGRGGRVGRRTDLDRALGRALGRAGIVPARVSTHTGRRTVITLLYQAGVPLADIARHVGHADVATTARYVVDLGIRPAEVAAQAAALFDPTVS